MMVGLIIVTGYTSINAIVKAELFPTEIRALGVGLPYALTVAIFGGTAEFIALWLKSIGMESLFYFYVADVSRSALLRIGVWMSHRKLRRLRRSLVMGIN